MAVHIFDAGDTRGHAVVTYRVIADSKEEAKEKLRQIVDQEHNTEVEIAPGVRLSTVVLNDDPDKINYIGAEETDD